jgi:2-dehydro-3-deoxyphosphogluconate aldolase / (4S)-4-hydroxy-2-oxoglutarate aldolase
MSSVLDHLHRHPVIAILRAPNADSFAQVASVLYDSGIRCLEFTPTTDGALHALKEAKTALPDDVLGMGTVRTPEHVEASIEAGAQFLVSQILKPQLVRAVDGRLPYLPGALTPTQIVSAWESGVPGAKVSPIGTVGGLAYLDQPQGPLPDVRLMPSGGINIDEVPDYISRGVVAVGLSSPLLGDALNPRADLSALAERARRAVATSTSV